jgi:hypothetical protein
MFITRKLFSLAPVAIALLSLRPDALNFNPPRGRMQTLPQLMLWVSERPKNLSTIDPRTTAIATLDRTLVLNRTLSVIPRRHPMTD